MNVWGAIIGFYSTPLLRLEGRIFGLVICLCTLMRPLCKCDHRLVSLEDEGIAYKCDLAKLDLWTSI